MMVFIDAEKLKEEINKHVFEATDIKSYRKLSISLGHSDNYIRSGLLRGRLSIRQIWELFESYNIALKDYISDKESIEYFSNLISLQSQRISKNDEDESEEELYY